MVFSVLYNLMEYGSGLALTALTVWADDACSGITTLLRGPEQNLIR